jgi:outer membrane protein TolC
VNDASLSERASRRNIRNQLDLNAEVSPTRGDSDFRLVEISDTPGEPPQLLTDNATDSSGEGWRVSLVYSVPLKNRQARANYAISRLTREQREIELQNTELAIRVEVRTAARNVESGVKRVEAARANSVLQRKTLEAEQKKFENGLSTSFEVLQIQTDLANAQLAEIRAILDYTKSLAALEAAKGTLLEARGMTLAEVTDGR